MAKYRCSVCGYIYDEGEEGRPFAQLEEGWRCPRCTAPKALFERVEEAPPPAGGEAPTPTPTWRKSTAWPAPG